MKKYLVSICGLVLLGLLVASAQETKPQDSSAGPTIQVRLNYSGSGTVDENHKIYVVLWDSPSFIQGQAMPVEIKPTATKNGTLTFLDVKTLPAYVSAAYDPNGQWDGKSGPPPAGSSLGMYSKTPGKPEPINAAPGKQVNVEIPFDDSIKMR